MRTPEINREATIRVRCESSLRPKLVRIARKHRKNFSEFVRQKLWEIADEAPDKEPKKRTAA